MEDAVKKVESIVGETDNHTEKLHVKAQTKSMVFSGLDIREDDINSLKPRGLITDAILSVMIRYM